ncbi:MAG: DUF805 domain-containing protein [Dehalococcoidia bacterium]
MSFADAVRSGLNNYANFSGRAMRSEYWFWVLFVLIVSLIANFVDSVLGGSGFIAVLVSLALLVPNIAVGVRRLHDINKTGWNVLWGLIPILGWIYLIYLAVQPSNPGSNNYGPEPSGTPSAA